MTQPHENRTIADPPSSFSAAATPLPDRRESFNPWPWAIIATFVLFISGTVSLVVMACSQREDLVSGDYYDKEIKFQQQLDSLTRARNLGTSVSVAYDRANNRIQIALPPDQLQPSLSGHIELYRPSAADQDRSFQLRPDNSGVQTLDTAGMARGLWKVRIYWKSQQQDYLVDGALNI